MEHKEHKTYNDDCISCVKDNLSKVTQQLEKEKQDNEKILNTEINTIVRDNRNYIRELMTKGRVK